VSGEVILLSVRTQKIRTEPLSFLIFSEPHPRHLSSSVEIEQENINVQAISRQVKLFFIMFNNINQFIPCQRLGFIVSLNY
jgi:hypothetical protein